MKISEVGVKASSAPQPVHHAEAHRQWLVALEREWGALNGKTETVKGVMAPLFQAQLAAQRLHLFTETLAKAADGVSNTVKRLQQAAP